MAAALASKPIDLRDASLFKQGASETAIARTLAEGISTTHTSPEAGGTRHDFLMPKFDHLTDTERRSIALYVISIRSNASLVARDAWARVPTPSKTETALYMVLENQSSQPKVVVSASSDAAGKVEMHEMKTIRVEKPDEKAGNMPSMGKMADQTMMAMTPVAEIAIPAKGKVNLSPNGLHLMLFGLKSRPAEGDKLTVTLKLDDGTAVPVSAVVRK